MNFFRYNKSYLFVENLLVDKLARKLETPFYCYSLSQIHYNISKFQKSFKRVKPLICFSVKSNSNITILKEFKKRECGADVVSIGELISALKAGINPKKIVFSGIGKTEKELEFAIKKNILLINVESESEANLINKISKKLSKTTSIGIRYNPNIDAKTHRKISTGRKIDKFGFTEKNLLEFYKKSKKLKNISLDCLSVHIGSQITKINPFKKLKKSINKIIKKIRYKFKFVDLGGGIGIPYSLNDKKIDLNAYSKLVEKFKKNHNCKIIFEPGRSMVGNAAILISKVIYVKKGLNKDFIIMDAGMNDLIRPALYGVNHQILPAKKNNYKSKRKLEFVGPICESSDKFLETKKFQKINENDFLVISDVGAYGMSLSSNYNLRPKLLELLVSKNKSKIIRRRQTLSELIRR